MLAGADKVAINTAAVKSPEFISQAANRFGKSTIVAAIEAIKSSDGNYYAFTDNGREETGLEVVKWAKQLEALGAGEIIVTSVDNEGTCKGFDEELSRQVLENVSVPVIIHGGASDVIAIASTCQKLSPSGVAIASSFHYCALDEVKYDAEKMPNEGNKEFISNNRHFQKASKVRLDDLKSALSANGIENRKISTIKPISLAKKNKKISILDYNMGNIFSLIQCFKSLGCEVSVESKVENVGKGSAIVLPGVGAFHSAMETLRINNQVQQLQTTAKQGLPVLGICLGMQLFMQSSVEFGRCDGLGFIEGDVIPFSNKGENGQKMRVPNIGWRKTSLASHDSQINSEYAQIDGEEMYYVHSFYCKNKKPEDLLFSCEFGDMSFAAALRRNNLVGVQFHPEKSGDAGAAFLTTWLNELT